MDKKKFKKLAVMGMAGGMLMAGQATAIAGMNVASAGCGKGGCSASKSSRYYTADAEDTLNQQQMNTSYPQSQPQPRSSSCSAAPQQQWNTQPQPRSSSCNAAPMPQQWSYQPRQSCGAPQPQPQQWAQQGCGGQQRPQGPQGNPNTYSADAYDTMNRPSSQNQFGGSQGQFSGQRGNQQQQDWSTPQPQTTGKMMSEGDLLPLLSKEGKTIYQNLSPEGKEIARKLASQSTYADKNDAVKAADAMQKRGALGGKSR